MKKLAANVLTFLFLLIGGPLYAQQSWQWGQRVGIMVNDIATDGAGNVYALWSLHGSYTIDGHVITGYDTNNGDIALTSFSCDGTYRWTKVIGGESVDVGLAVGTDTLGGVYLTGGVVSDNYQNSIYVSGDTTIAPTARRMILLKYDTAGNFQWFRMPEPDTLTGFHLSGLSTFLFNMDVSPDGVCYCYTVLAPRSYANGAFSATFPAGTNRGENVYALKYDRNGNCTGGVHFDMYYSGASFTYTRFKRDPLSGNYYLGGNVGSSFTPGDSLIFGNVIVTVPIGDVRGYVAAFDSAGGFQWLQQTENPEGYPHIMKPAIDGQGSVYIPGDTYDTNRLGGWFMSNDLGSSTHPFIIKIDPTDGHAIWGATASTNAADNGFAASVTNGVVAFTGSVNGKMVWGNNFQLYQPPGQNQGYNVFLVRFNAATGTVLSLDTLGSSMQADDYPAVLSSDKQGNFYVGGTFKNALYVGPDTIYNQSSNTDGFIAKFGSANCNCTLPAAHYTHNGLQSGGTISFNYDGSSPVDSVVWDFGDGESGSGTNVTHSYPQDGSYTVCATAYNDCGSNMYCETLQVGDVGIGKIPGFAGISIYPNPTTEEIIIDNAERGIVLDIYNVTGQQMLHQVLKGTKDKVDVSNLSSGVYLMRFKDKKGRQGNSKFVKQ